MPWVLSVWRMYMLGGLGSPLGKYNGVEIAHWLVITLGQTFYLPSTHGGQYIPTMLSMTRVRVCFGTNWPLLLFTCLMFYWDKATNVLPYHYCPMGTPDTQVRLVQRVLSICYWIQASTYYGLSRYEWGISPIPHTCTTSLGTTSVLIGCV